MTDEQSLRRNDERRLRLEGRLPPGQSVTLKFPVLDLGIHPEIDPESWELRVFGAVEQEIRLGWEAFRLLPTRKVTLDLHCVTRWSKFDTEWEGVSVQDLVKRGLIKPLAGARHVVQHAADGYATNLPLSVVLQDNYLLAHRYAGQPIPPEHGFPVRAVIGALPGAPDVFTPYLWKGAKWITSLEIVEEDRPGFWEKNGYHNEACARQEQRYSER
jgi:DMSO/TMAO reductase YedYZ molybdopterin-dependent catalytic subunit